MTSDGSEPLSGGADARFRLSPDVVAQRLGDGIILVNIQTDRMFELNRTASRFWELLISGRSPSEARQQILEEFSVGEAQLNEEADKILSSLLAERMLRVDDKS